MTAAIDRPGDPHPTIKYRIPSIHPDGRRFVLLSAAIAVALAFVWSPLFWLMAGVTVWVATFFRDPLRTTPLGEGLIVSPADGLVVRVTQVMPPPQLSGPDGLPPEFHTRVSVFMSVFDVHVNRAPIAGRIGRIAYVPGRFINADLDKASDDNERQYMLVESERGARVAFTQIAGLIARRIVTEVREGDRVEAGERVGLIRFGSRVDIYLPPGTGSWAVPGQRAIAGETVIGRIGISGNAAGLTQ